MKSIKRGLVGALTASIAGGGLLLGASSASAATVPPWEPDPNALGSLSFYDASGNVVTSGNNLAHLFDYAVASTPASRTGTTKATLYFAQPDHTQPNSQTWTAGSASAATTFPNTTAPPPINGFGRQPVANPGPLDANLTSFLGNAIPDTTAGYANIIQIRVKDSGAGIGNGLLSTFWETDISYNTTTGTWTQLYPAPVVATTTSVAAITASPSTPTSSTTSTTLTSTVSAADASHPAGAVELFDGSNDLGPATFTAATGAVSATATVAPSTSYNFRFVFTPTTPTAYSGSSSPVLAYSVPGPAATTSTVLSGPTTTTYGTPVTIHATVFSPAGGTTAVPATAGSVQFSVAGTASGAPVPLTATGADFSYNPPAAGTQTITAAFVPAAGQNYGASNDATGVTVVTSAPANAPDVQTVVVTVPAGTLVISTPYTPANPFNLGTMKLSADGQSLATTPVNFGDPAVPATADPGTTGTTTNGVTITDTRAGSTGWTASAQSSNFTGPVGTTTLIPGDNLSFTSVAPKYITGNALQAGMVNVHDITNFGPVGGKKAFADTTHGPGTVNITGKLSLTAPTSTQPGLYTATVTFTIV